MAKTYNLQDVILNNVRRERQLITLHLISGLPLRGYVRAFDNFVILLDSPEGRQMMIYKHAVSTLTPPRPVTYTDKDEGYERIDTQGAAGADSSFFRA